MKWQINQWGRADRQSHTTSQILTNIDKKAEGNKNSLLLNDVGRISGSSFTWVIEWVQDQPGHLSDCLF